MLGRCLRRPSTPRRALNLIASLNRLKRQLVLPVPAGADATPACESWAPSYVSACPSYYSSDAKVGPQAGIAKCLISKDIVVRLRLGR